MIRIGTLVIVVLIFTFSCKSSKTSSTNITHLSAKKVIKKHYAAGFDKNNLKANLTIKYKGNAGLPNLNASLRMIKDSVIWISVTKFGIPVAKIIIDKNEVKYYEKLSKTYFIGNFDLISHWLGIEFDFNQIQNLFLGESLLNLNEKKYEIQIHENLYSLNPKDNSFLFDIFFWINPTNFKLEKEEIIDAEKEQTLKITYSGYEKMENTFFPKGFIIDVTDKKNKTIVDINYRNVIFDTALSFPFKIPNGYNELNINDN